MAFKMKGFKAHDMFDPKTGEKKVAETKQEHLDLQDKGWGHEQSSALKACWKGYEMFGMKKKGGRSVPNCVPKKK